MLGHEIKSGTKLRRIVPQDVGFSRKRGFAQEGDVITVDVVCQTSVSAEGGHHGIYYRFNNKSVFDCVYDETQSELQPAWEIVK